MRTRIATATISLLALAAALAPTAYAAAAPHRATAETTYGGRVAASDAPRQSPAAAGPEQPPVAEPVVAGEHAAEDGEAARAVEDGPPVLDAEPEHAVAESAAQAVEELGPRPDSGSDGLEVAKDADEESGDKGGSDEERCEEGSLSWNAINALTDLLQRTAEGLLMEGLSDSFQIVWDTGGEIQQDYEDSCMSLEPEENDGSGEEEES